MSDGQRINVLLVHPIPPPWAGVEQVGKMLIEGQWSPQIKIHLLKSNIRTRNTEKGYINFSGLVRVVSVWTRLVFWSIFKRPDIVYFPISQNTSGLLRDSILILTAKLLFMPTIGHFHGSSLTPFFKSSGFIIRKFVFFALNKINVWIVLTEFIKNELKRIFPTSKLHVIPNGVPDRPTDVQNKNNNSGPVRVTFMGHLAKAKGFFDVLEAVDNCLKSGLSISFHFAGEFLKDEKNIAAISNRDIEKQGLERLRSLKDNYGKSIEHVGVVSGEKKKEFFGKSDIFVFPSYSESFGLVILEAMQHKNPLILTRVGFSSSVLKEKENALFVDQGDVKAIESSIRYLVENPNERLAMGEENFKRVQEFSSEKMIQAIESLFVECVPQKV